MHSLHRHHIVILHPTNKLSGSYIESWSYPSKKELTDSFLDDLTTLLRYHCLYSVELEGGSK
jgi:hypothetical protein